MSYYGCIRHILYSFLPLVILAKVKHHFSGRRAVLKRDVQALDSYVRKSALLDWRVLHVRADTLRKGRDETSECYGRCWRPRIAEISGYNKL